MMRNSKGFTMIELIMALLILILGVTAALRLFPTGLKSGRSAAIITNTGFVACAAFEGYAKRVPFDELSRRSSPFQPFFKKPSAGSFGGGELTPEWVVADYKPGAESFIRGTTFPICIPNVSKVTISVPIPEIVAEHGWVEWMSGTGMRAVDENGQPFSWEDGQFNGMMLVMVTGRGRGKAYIIRETQSPNLIRVRNGIALQNEIDEGDEFIIARRYEFVTFIANKE